MHTWKRFLTIKDPEPELLVRAWQRQGWLGELRRWVGTGCECGKRWVPARVRLEIVQHTDKGESVMARGGLHTAREGRLSGANQPRVPLGESCSDHPSLPIPGRERSAAAPIKSLLLGAREAGFFSVMHALLCKAFTDLALEVMHHFHNLLIIRKSHREGITLHFFKGKQ